MNTAIVPTNFDYPEASNTWEAARFWDRHDPALRSAKLTCQVMTGFTLIEIKESYGTNQGARTDLTSPNDSEKLKWPDLVKAEAGISDDTARNWMAMAEKVKSRWKSLPIRDRLRRKTRFFTA